MNRYIRKILFVIIFSCLAFALAHTAVAASTTDTLITTGGVNLRSAPSTDSAVVTTIGSGTRVTLISHDPAGWSRVRINGTEGFISSEFLTLPNGHAPITFTTTGGVNLRTAPSTDATVSRVLSTGTNVEVLSHNPSGWSNVRVNGATGFISSEFIMLSAASTSPAANTAPAANVTSAASTTPAANTTSSANTTAIRTLQTIGGVNLRTGPSTDTGVIRVLNTGTRVEVLNNGSNGWSEVRFNGNTGFIKTELLTEVSSRSAELLTWPEARRLITKGANIPVYDVRTGRTFNVRAFSLGGHADVDTVTQADTNTKFDIRGGRWSWAARPVLVTIGGRTVAAAINAMPHGGSAIPGNGVDGHFCLHFHETVTINQRYQADLRSAVLEAYNASRRR